MSGSMEGPSVGDLGGGSVGQWLSSWRFLIREIVLAGPYCLFIVHHENGCVQLPQGDKRLNTFYRK